MAATFALLDLDLFAEPSPQPKKPGSWKCECGLFARFLRDRHYYNGSWDCYNYTVACKRCGEVTVECV